MNLTGDLIYRRRKELNITQRFLGKHLGYSSAQMISNIERGVSHPSKRSLLKLAKLLKIKMSDIQNMIIRDNIQSLINERELINKK